MGVLQIRIDEEEKQELKEIFGRMGMTMSGGIKLFLKRVREEEQLPFEVVASRTNNKKTVPVPKITETPREEMVHPKVITEETAIEPPEPQIKPEEEVVFEKKEEMVAQDPTIAQPEPPQARKHRFQSSVSR